MNLFVNQRQSLIKNIKSVFIRYKFFLEVDDRHRVDFQDFQITKISVITSPNSISNFVGTIQYFYKVFTSFFRNKTWCFIL